MLNNMGRVTGQREVRPVWNNAQRVNHQNNLTHPHPKRNFVPTAVATKSGLVPVNAAKQSSLRAAASISTVRHVNTAASKPRVNVASSTKYSYFKAHSPLRRPFNQKSAVKTNNFNEKVYTAKLNNVTTAGPEVVVSTAVGNGENAIIKTLMDDLLHLLEVLKEELKFNLFSVSQMCDKKNSVLFTETECLVLSPDFKLLDESQVLLKVPRQNNMYSFDLKNVVPSGGLTCLFAKAIIDESNLWHRRLGHINFKTMNKLVRGNLVRGLPSKLFENDHTCVACHKGKQHKASCKTKLVSSISQPLQMLHMDLFGPTSVRSINHKTYFLVVTDDYSRYERLKKIPEELGIQSALHAPAPKQASSQLSGRKRKIIYLEPEIRIPGLECNRSLPEGVLFVNNMVIEEPEYGMFFIDFVGDKAFQRMSGIHKVDVETLLTYFVMASTITTPKNQRFCLKLRKLSRDHPDQEKLKSKSVKLEAVGYKLDLVLM
ncbi:putative ribonuclease H-like domain-containing protein [Tanacetum coccineum]